MNIPLAVADSEKEAEGVAFASTCLIPCRLRLIMLESVASLPVNLLTVALMLTVENNEATMRFTAPITKVGENSAPNVTLASTVLTG